MKMRQLLLALTFATTGTLAVTGLGLGLVIGQTTAAKAEGIRSGYSYATKETQGLQDDDMSNPGYLGWIQAKVCGARQKAMRASPVTTVTAMQLSP